MPKKSAEQKLLQLIEEKGCDWIQSQLKIAKLIEKSVERKWSLTNDGAK